jgi:hypothetical protein
MIVGFTWGGGWVMGSTAKTMALVRPYDAVVSRLAPMCVVESKQDPRRNQEFRELKAFLESAVQRIDRAIGATNTAMLDVKASAGQR